MSDEFSDSEKMRRMPWFYAHNATNHMFSALTWFGPVFVLFLSEFDLAKTRIGFLLSLLPFSGVLALFIAPAVARIGLRLVYLFCWTARTTVTAFLLLTPWVVSRHGTEGAFLYITVLMALFCALRAVGETAWQPWNHELIPHRVRGRVQAINHMITVLTGSLLLAGASWVLDHDTGLGRFMTLIVIGVGGGYVSVLCALGLRGGSRGGQLRKTAHINLMRQALRDGPFRLFLVYTALAIVTMQSVLGSFVPLFMKEQIGLPDSQVVLLEVAAGICGILSSYGWGVWADRAGSRPLVPIMGITLLLPLLWVVLPRQSEWSFPAAIGVSALSGLVFTGWWIVQNRLLYVEIVPPEKRVEYLAIHYAWIGLVGGCGPLAAGAVLDAFREFSGQLGLLVLDPYTPLFAGSVVTLAAGLFVLVALRRRLGLRRASLPTAPA
jgi:hypothetical protein